MHSPDSLLKALFNKTKQSKVLQKTSADKTMIEPNWEFDYGKISKNLVEYEPIKNLFYEMFKSLTKDFFNTIEHDKDFVQTKNVEKKINELLNHELLNDYITTHKLPEKEANRLFTLFIDKVLTKFIQMKSTNLEQYPKDNIEKLTTYLNDLNEIWKIKIRKKYEVRDTNK